MVRGCARAIVALAVLIAIHSAPAARAQGAGGSINDLLTGETSSGPEDGGEPAISARSVPIADPEGFSVPAAAMRRALSSAAPSDGSGSFYIEDATPENVEVALRELGFKTRMDTSSKHFPVVFAEIDKHWFSLSFIRFGDRYAMIVFRACYIVDRRTWRDISYAKIHEFTASYDLFKLYKRRGGKNRLVFLSVPVWTAQGIGKEQLRGNLIALLAGHSLFKEHFKLK